MINLFCIYAIHIQIGRLHILGFNILYFENIRQELNDYEDNGSIIIMIVS